VEARLVALVQADDLADVGVALHDLGRVLREELHAVRRVDERAGLLRVDREDHLDAVAHRIRQRTVEEGLVEDGVRLRGIPEDRHAVLGHPEVCEHVEEARAAVLGVLSGVVGDAEGGARGPARKA